jgi:integrase
MAKRQDHEGHYYTEKRQTKTGTKTYYCWKIQLAGMKPIVVKRQTAAARKTEVDKKIKELQQKGFLEPASADQTVKQRLTQWLETRVKPNKEPSTYESYESVCRLYIFPAIGKAKVSKLNAMHVQQVVAYVQGLRRTTRSGEEVALSGRTAQYAVSVLCRGLPSRDAALLRAAAKDGDVEIPRANPPRDRYLEHEEIDALLKEAYRRRELKTRPGESVYVYRERHLLKFLLNAGLRISEGLGLLMVDVNFKEEHVEVRRQIAWEKDEKTGKKKWRLKPRTKTGENRTVPLTPAAIEAIREQIAMVQDDQEKAGRAYEDNGLLFATQRGTPLTERNVLRTVNAIIDELELEHATPHDLRRTFGTHLADQEERMQIVASALGHKKIETTAAYYVRARARERKASVSKLRLGGGAPGKKASEA